MVERTAGSGGVVLDVLPLTVELVVDNPVGLGLAAVVTALGDIANRSSTGPLAHTKAEAEHAALREHG